MQARIGKTQPPWYRLLQLAEPVKEELAESQATSAPAETAMAEELQESQAAGLVEPGCDDLGEEGGGEEEAVVDPEEEAETLEDPEEGEEEEEEEKGKWRFRRGS